MIFGDFKVNIKEIMFFLLAVFLIFNVPPAETTMREINQEPLEVIIKTGVHEGFVRAVFFMSESAIKDASVTQIDNAVKVNLNRAVFFKSKAKDLGKEYTKIDSPMKLIDGLIVEPKKDGAILKKENLTHIKILKLSNPSRLVIDMYFSGTIVEKEKQSRYNIIMIDPGHGGYDRGIYSDSFSEKNFVLAFSKAFAERVERIGKKAILLRNADYAISMKDRIKAINKKRPDVLISFHLSLKDEFVVYQTNPIGEKDGLNQIFKESEIISQSIMANIKNLGIRVRIEKIDSIIGSYIYLPSIFIELPNPERFTYDKKINQKIIEAILNSLEG
jgi:N-acetylmuramoyl-L-alanine amidase